MEGRDNFSAAEKKRMTLSKDTLDGLRIYDRSGRAVYLNKYLTHNYIHLCIIFIVIE